MNYIEFEIGDKKRGFRLGLGAIGDLITYHETDFMGLATMFSNNNIFSLVPSVLFFGHKHAVKKEKGIIDFDIYDVEQWIDELEDGLLDENVQKTLILFAETLTGHLKKSTGEKEEAKKK